MALTLEQLNTYLVDAAAVRRVARLQPGGGVGDKVYPPTYEGGQYACDTRVVDGERLPCVLLDSVQSQANRLELALLAAHRAGRIAIPVVTVDFAPDMPEVGTITSLEAPHRLADAILRDSLLDGVAFRKSEVGRVLDAASTSNATGLFEVCPTALVFGLWDSTGPLRAAGVKFARALVSEVVAVDAELGVRPASRVDPLGIQKDAAILYKPKSGEGWTLDEKLAELDKNKKPVRIGKEGKPSEINHGNVTPSLKGDKGPNHGGVTFRYARQVAVLSLPALRRLRFPEASGAVRIERDRAAQATLAALAICALAIHAVEGLDLRSRCLLVPEPGHATDFEIVGADGAVERLSISAAEACALLQQAVAAAKKAGLGWRAEGIALKPKPEFFELVKRSRELAAQSDTAES
jgi:CRISPR-associated protein Csb1